MEGLYQNGINDLSAKIIQDGVSKRRDVEHFTPSTIEEMKQIINSARNENLQINTINSFNVPFADEHESTSKLFIDLQKFNKIIEIDVTNKLVTVQGGTLLGTINTYLEKAGLTLDIPTTSLNLTVAEAIGTAVHVSNAKCGIFASYVQQLEMLTSKKTIVVCSKNSKEEILRAACCGLGMCGIILQATLRCNEIRNVEHLQIGCSFSKVTEKLGTCLDKNPSLRMFWFPHTDNVVIYTSKKTKKKMSKSTLRKQATDWYFDVAINVYVTQFLYWICLFLPFLLPLAHHIIFWVGFVWRRNFILSSNHPTTLKIPDHHHITEWAVPLERAQEALKKLYRWSEIGPHFLHFPVDIQFIREDDAYLSPASGKNICTICLTITRPFNYYFPHKLAFEEFAELMKTVGGRPVWGKASELTKVTLEDLYDMFPHFDSWHITRDKLDPHNVFACGLFLEGPQKKQNDV